MPVHCPRAKLIGASFPKDNIGPLELIASSNSI